jgi:cell division protein FtsB
VVRPRKLLEHPVRPYRYLRSAYRGKNLVTPSRLRWGLLAVLLGIYLINFFGGDHGVFHRLGLERELDTITSDNARLRLQKERLLHEVQAKENDPLSLERLAREKYWMAAPGEQIYRFPDDEVVPEIAVPGGDEDGSEGTEGDGPEDGGGP